LLIADKSSQKRDLSTVQAILRRIQSGPSHG
jgi:hypothetical protein